MIPAARPPRGSPWHRGRRGTARVRRSRAAGPGLSPIGASEPVRRSAARPARRGLPGASERLPALSGLAQCPAGCWPGGGSEVSLFFTGRAL
eukprot:753144-Hanusia_phi.AAC.1